jgi:hypothetical protein
MDGRTDGRTDGRMDGRKGGGGGRVPSLGIAPINSQTD